MCELANRNGLKKQTETFHQMPRVTAYSQIIIIIIIIIIAGGKIEKNEMGGACGAYGEGERGVQGSGGET